MERCNEHADVRTGFVRRSPAPYLQAFHHPSHRTLAHCPAQRAARRRRSPHPPEARAVERGNRNDALQPDARIQPHHRHGCAGTGGIHSETFLERTQPAPPANRSGAAGFLRPTALRRSARCRQRNLVVRVPANPRKYDRSRHFRSSAKHHRTFRSGPSQKLLREQNMQFGLTESQEFLKNSARKFFAGECPSMEMRRLMQTDTAYDATLWSKLTAQGYTGIVFPEAYGGVGLGKVEL